MPDTPISSALTDDAILAELGHRLARSRLQRGVTQAALADEAGVSKRTVERVEAGESAALSSVVRILRALDLIDALDQAIPSVSPGPMELLRRKGRLRQRASSPRTPSEAQPSSWTWDDES